MSPADRPGCAAASREIGEELPGTAPHARGWVVIEQPGPFGHDALFESHLPVAIASRLTDALEDSEIKIVLARRTVLHGGNPSTARSLGGPSGGAPGAAGAAGAPGAAAAPERSVWWTFDSPEPKLYRLSFTDPRELAELDWSALRHGRPDQVQLRAEVCRDPLLLLCTNGRRDVCCAALARPVAAALARDERYRDSFIESSHLGGHRFAPGAVQLPHGWAHGRLDAVSAGTVLDGARSGRVCLDSARGRSGLPAAGQVAEIAVRRAARYDELAGVSVAESEFDQHSGSGPAAAPDSSGPVSSAGPPSRASTLVSTWAVNIVGVGAWTVAVRAGVGPSRPESCGATPIPMPRYAVDVRSQTR